MAESEGASLLSQTEASSAQGPRSRRRVVPDRSDKRIYRQHNNVFEEDPPLKSIFLALFLFSVGTIMLTLGICVLTGVIDADKHWPEAGWKNQAISFIVLGSISFLPGSYVTWIAYQSFKGTPGYSYKLIPGAED
mmetsp:Transcript_12086/g.27897  ORF Transcript_12086/g.27897 Transcript_12086/m.27897 type:complete len:135 (-) Transcript_12086:51-455(-)